MQAEFARSCRDAEGVLGRLNAVRAAGEAEPPELGEAMKVLAAAVGRNPKIVETVPPAFGFIGGCDLSAVREDVRRWVEEAVQAKWTVAQVEAG